MEALFPFPPIPMKISTLALQGDSMALNHSVAKAQEFSRQGYQLLKSGRRDPALDAFRQAARQFAECGNHKEEVRHKLIMADTCCAANRHDEAMALYKEVRPFLRRAEDGLSLARISNNLGLIHARTGNYEAAMEDFRQAMTLFEECGQKLQMAEQLGNMGSVSRDRKNFGTALGFYHLALNMFQKIGAGEQCGDQHANIGYVHVMLGDRSNALTSFEKAHAFYARIDNKAKVELTVQNIEGLKTHPGA
jgi:tetratricopeptide (TPR) repeat protein